MRLGKTTALMVLVALVAGSIGGCGSGGDAAGSTTLTYWAVPQASTAERDKAVLTPELDKFTAQTGIKVELEMLTWANAYSKILSAVSSGQGPDLVEIGNTWSAALQATGAFLPFDDAAMDAIGGRDRFLASSMTSTGAAGRDPAAVPLFGQAYGLFYNTKLFAEAGIARPPATWDEFVADAKKLTKPGQWGVAVPGASDSVNAHFAFMLGRQNGARLFDGAGRPQFDAPAEIAAVTRYLDLMSAEHVVNPSAAEYSGSDFLADFAQGKAAMVMYQSSARATLAATGFTDYAVAPMPVLSPLPPQGAAVASIIGGVNLAVFHNTQHKAAALKLVEFLTSHGEQVALNKGYNSLPVVTSAYTDPAFADPATTTFGTVLREQSETMPMIAEEGRMEAVLGGAVSNLWAEAATGGVSEADITTALTKANKQMAASR